VDLDFIEQSFGDSSGPLFKVDGWFEFPDTGDRYVWKPGTMMYLGNDPRSTGGGTTTGGAGGARRLGTSDRLPGVPGPTRTPNDVFGSEIEERLPPEDWIHSVVVRVLVDAWDTVGVLGGKNAYLYQDPRRPSGGCSLSTTTRRSGRTGARRS